MSLGRTWQRREGTVSGEQEKKPVVTKSSENRKDYGFGGDSDGEYGLKRD